MASPRSSCLRPAGLPARSSPSSACPARPAVARRNPTPPLHSLSEALGPDVAATASSAAVDAAADLITRHMVLHFGEDAVGTHSQATGQLMRTLQNALHGSSYLFHPQQAAVDAAQVLVSHATDPSLAGDMAAAAAPAVSPLMELGTAAVPALADIVTSPAVHSAAVATIDATTANLYALGHWASANLQAVQAVDPESYAALSGAVDSVLSALRDALDSQAAQQAQAWTNALVLGVQHIMAAAAAAAPDAVPGGPGAGFGAEASSSFAGATSLPAMLAAQDAMAAVLSSLGAAPGGGMQAVARAAAGQQQVQQQAPVLPFVMGILAMIVACIPRSFDQPSGSSSSSSGASGFSSRKDEPPLRYDPAELDDYWFRRPLPVLRRNAQVAGSLSGFAVVILADWKMGKWEENMPRRAVEFRVIVENLGAAYIKIAQQLSTRVDLVPEPYLVEFRRLQDNVRTFSTTEARSVLEDGLGRPVDSVFEWLSAEPIAAASLGQVYKGRLKGALGGGDVAVKVQRPGVLESISLDIFIMRRAVTLMAAMPFMSDRWATVLDDWAVRFFEELDYQLEAENTSTFKQQMAGLQGIAVATPYAELTSRRVIVTEWVVGERLNDTKAEDVRALCSTLLNCYLIQLLETGLLHADPHPGNLLRMEDGRIVILDFGLMTEVSEDQRVALVEFIAHLTMEDWDGVAGDLVHLGFMPDGLPQDAREQIAPVMQSVMGQIVKGGGLRGFNIGSMMGMLEGVAMDYKMCLPGYFTLVLRAFCVIEGIALQVDPDYAIVQECLPYLSRRLLSDNNPRMRAALRQLLYGTGTRLDVERLTKMMAAFGAFSTSVSSAAGSQASGPTFSSAYSPSGATERVKGKAPGGLGAAAAVGLGGLGAADEGPLVNEATKEALRVVFSKDGSYAQELIVEEMVAAVDAMSREAMGEALRMVMTSAGAVAVARSYESLGPLRSMLLPLPPAALDRASASGGGGGFGAFAAPPPAPYPLLALSAEDRQSLAMVRTLLDFAQPSLASVPDVAANGHRAFRAAGELMPLLHELMPGVQATVELFARQLVRRMALRLAEDLAMPQQQQQLEQQRQQAAQARAQQQAQAQPTEAAMAVAAVAVAGAAARGGPGGGGAGGKPAASLPDLGKPRR